LSLFAVIQRLTMTPVMSFYDRCFVVYDNWCVVQGEYRHFYFGVTLRLRI